VQLGDAGRRHHPDRVHDRASRAQWFGQLVPFGLVTEEDQLQHGEALPAQRLGDHGQRRELQHPADRGDLVGNRAGPVQPGPEDFGRTVPGEEHRPRIDFGHLVQLEFEREAVDVLAGSPARLEFAQALAALGSALRRSGRPGEAREPLRQALDLATACGAGGLAQHARAELYAAGARPRTEALHGVESLTPSERRVAGMAADGTANKVIAQTLYVTPKTVELHLSSAYRKLGIRSRRELPAALVPR
jgi:DNA-binding CsgD family transcriptional regulator